MIVYCTKRVNGAGLTVDSIGSKKRLRDSHTRFLLPTPRKIYPEKKEMAQVDETVETICFDYQQNLPVPVLTTGEIYYARQIWVFNQLFYSSSKNRLYV